MRCLDCPGSSDGYAVIPGIGEAGEIRFFCDACARRSRVKMRYWDGRDLDVGGHRDDPDLGESFPALILSFDDAVRMRLQDLAAAFDWVEDADLAGALVGAPAPLLAKVLSALQPERVGKVRRLLGQGSSAEEASKARRRIVDVIRRL